MAATRAYGSQVFFAKYLGVPLEELQNWINGSSQPTEAQLRAAAEVLRGSKDGKAG
jgi:DNA-binding transcriptional regulator YiaG